MLAIGNFLRHIFIENPLINFYILSQLKDIVLKVMHSESGLTFVASLLEDTLHHYNQTELKYKSKPKQQKSLYFGKNGSPEKHSKHEEAEMQIK